MGLLLAIAVTAAFVQDRDGARALLWRLRARFLTASPGLGRWRPGRGAAAGLGASLALGPADPYLAH